jgi:phosphatidylglycerol:prolipoprotein diacylglycerol transferase
VLFYEPARYLTDPIEIFRIWRGGMAFHGGLAGAILGIVLFARRRGLAPLAQLDLAAVVVPIGILLGRLANFVNGELWGRVAGELPWAIVFPGAGSQPRHPSQLYEAFAEGLILLILLGFLARRWGFRRPGRLGGAFGIGYAAARIACEFFREPDPQLGYLFGGWLTMGMLLSLPMLAIGGFLLFRAKPLENQAKPA